MSTMTPVPENHPLMIAWTAYKATEDFANSRRWAAHDEHLTGSLWAMYEAGWRAAQAQQPAPAEPDPMLASEIKPRALDYPLSDYHRAMFVGPLHAQWEDKPHRLVYDLIAAVRFYAAAAAVQPPVVQLTEEEIEQLACAAGITTSYRTHTGEFIYHINDEKLARFARAIEAKVRGIGSVPPSANPDSVHQAGRSGGGVRTEPDDSSGSV